jgi:DNA-binding CsgD family transcriptional regulator
VKEVNRLLRQVEDRPAWACRLAPERARAHLLYGEWLRREGRRVDAREQLHTAHEPLAAIGLDAFAERARRELMAAGEKVRKRTSETRWDLTAQEAQIAQLAREGHSVEWHMRKVFAKLDITSRKELAGALREPQPA